VTELLEGGNNPSFSEHQIHRGYFRILDSLAVDIEHGNVNTLMGVVFRQAYAEQIIDKFVGELPGPSRFPSRWRSAVLNPILQRQLHGFGDNDPSRLKTHFNTLPQPAQTSFYLEYDPLHPSMLPRLQKGIMHVTVARWHLGLIDRTYLSEDWYRSCEEATGELIFIYQKHGHSDQWRKQQAKVLLKEGLSAFME